MLRFATLNAAWMVWDGPAPKREEAVQKGQFLAGCGSAILSVSKRNGGHQQASQDDS